MLNLGTQDDHLIELLPSEFRLRPVGLTVSPAPAPLAAVDAPDAMRKLARLFGQERSDSPFNAICIPDQCTLTWLNPAAQVPFLVFQGDRDSTGQMGGLLHLGSWYRATGRVGFDRGNRMVVHMQDVDIGQSEALGRQITVGGIVRNTFRYFNTSDIRGLSLSAEIGPVLGIPLRGLGGVLSASVTTGPDVLFTSGLSGTANLSLVYAR